MLDIFFTVKKSDAKKRIEELKELINTHNHNYYVLNSPVISDFEYDILMNELIELEKRFPQYQTQDSPTQKVGSDLSQADNGGERGGFRQYRHQYPMLSLGNTYDMTEPYEFDRRIKKVADTPFPDNC